MRSRPSFTGILLSSVFLALLLGTALHGSPSLRAEEATNLKNDTTNDTTNSTIANLVLGEYWFGAQIEAGDLEGKVVLFEIWGS